MGGVTVAVLKYILWGRPSSLDTWCRFSAGPSLRDNRERDNLSKLHWRSRLPRSREDKVHSAGRLKQSGHSNDL
jgi:hypothetical protein